MRPGPGLMRLDQVLGLMRLPWTRSWSHEAALDQAVVRGQQASRWLCAFLEVRRRLQVKPYLEDDRQLDRVYLYLKELFHRVTDHAPCLANVKFMDDVRFVLDVLLPEAIISAIAGVDNISLNKAEEKYLNGRCISEREREEFELTIGRMRSALRPTL
ncbi:unnamed protein product [Arctogadus glacialis]